MRERIVNGILGRGGEVMGRSPRVQIENIENITVSQEWLYNGGSLLVYFLPHQCMYDPNVVTERIIRPFLRPYASDYGWLASVKATGELPEIPETVGIAQKGSHAYAERAGFQMWGVVQDYLINRYPAIEKKAMDINGRTALRAMRMINTRGGIVDISFEGSRFQTGGLHRGDPHAEKFLRPHRVPVAALPIILNGMHRMQPPTEKGFKKLNPFVAVNIHIGNLITYDEAIAVKTRYDWVDKNSMGDFTLVDALMFYAASTIPLEEYKPGVDPRGVYSPDYIIERAHIDSSEVII